MDLLLVKLLFTLRLTSDWQDPYALFIIKKHFPDSFREVACSGDGLCESCGMQGDCPFHATFAQQLADDPLAVKRHQKPSLPFVFHVPVLPPSLAAGDEVELGLVLVGTASRHVEEYCKAVLRLFGAGQASGIFPAKVVRIESPGCTGYRNLLMETGGALATNCLSTISLEDLMEMNTLPSDRISLRIEAPLRILVRSQPVQEFSASPLIRSLLRRISSLAYYYYGTVLELDYKRLARDSSSIALEENRVNWVEWNKGRTCGLRGSVMLRGNLTDYHPVLLLGELVQCGKDAAYGQGRFAVERLES